MKELNKKLGPLKLWQWLVIGGGTGAAYYLYEKKKESQAEVNPEEEEKLLGALDRGTGGGGSGGAEGGQIGVPGSQGPTGEAGPAGPAGISGPQGEAPSAALQAQVNALQEDLNKNNPKTLSHNGTAQALPKGWTRNAKGEAYRVRTIGNGIYHEYKDRKGPSKLLKVGTIHKPKAKTKRPKPTPVHKKVKAKHVPEKHKKREPVHR